MNNTKLGELNGWWVTLLKVKELTNTIAWPLVIAFFAYFVMPWAKGMEQRQDQFIVINHGHELRIMRLEEFKTSEPEEHRKDDRALEDKIMLGIAGQNQIILEKLTTKIDQLTESVNEMRVTIAAHVSKEL